MWPGANPSSTPAHQLSRLACPSVSTQSPMQQAVTLHPLCDGQAAQKSSGGHLLPTGPEGWAGPGDRSTCALALLYPGLLAWDPLPPFPPALREDSLSRSSASFTTAKSLCWGQDVPQEDQGPCSSCCHTANTNDQCHTCPSHSTTRHLTPIPHSPVCCSHAERPRPLMLHFAPSHYTTWQPVEPRGLRRAGQGP